MKLYQQRPNHRLVLVQWGARNLDRTIYDGANNFHTF